MAFTSLIPILLITLNLIWSSGDVTASPVQKENDHSDVTIINSWNEKPHHSISHERRKRQIFYPFVHPLYSDYPYYRYPQYYNYPDFGYNYYYYPDQPNYYTVDDMKESDCLNKVVGGTAGIPHSYPWMAALVKNGRQGCGGSLIDSRHILTAAHCVARMTTNDIRNLRVYLGAHDISVTSEQFRQVYAVSRVFYYSYFNSETFYGDIALLRLDRKVSTFDEKVHPICLSDGTPPFDFPGAQANLTGWGKLGANLSQPSKLQYVQLQVWTNEDCNAKYGQLAPGGITDAMVCAGRPGQDACNGDSGGPLTRIHPHSGERTEQIGIVSFGIGCGDYPGVYTRVDKYLDWIAKVRQIRDFY